MKNLFWFLFTVVSLFGLNGTAHAADKTTQILLINSFNQDIPWQKSVEQGLRLELQQQLSLFDLYVENLDIGRFDESMQKSSMKKLLAQKYHDKKIDFIVTQDIAAAALLTELDSLFHHIPRIYLEPGAKFKVPLGEKAVVVQPELDFNQATFSAIDIIKPTKVITIIDTDNELGVDLYQR
ncbi:MAG: hypothetical protein ACI8WB_006237, partial [Phenylobacterium sp.]